MGQLREMHGQMAKVSVKWREQALCSSICTDRINLSLLSLGLYDQNTMHIRMCEYVWARVGVGGANEMQAHISGGKKNANLDFHHLQQRSAASSIDPASAIGFFCVCVFTALSQVTANNLCHKSN